MATVRLPLLTLLGFILLTLAGMAQPATEPIFARRQDTAVIILNLDGRPQPATAVAYLVSGTLFVHGIWVEDSSARFGPAGLASAFNFRVDGGLGEHAINPGLKNGPLFSALYSGKSGTRLYNIFRADENGGAGMVNITSRDEGNVRGTFNFTAYNIGNPSDTKKISGNFDVNFRRLTQ